MSFLGREAARRAKNWRQVPRHIKIGRRTFFKVYCNGRAASRKTSGSGLLSIFPVAWVSGVSGRKGERWKRKRERAEGEKRLTQMLSLEPSTPKQHDSIPSNQNHFPSLGCQLHVSKRSPKINLTLRSGRAPVPVLLGFRFFLKPPKSSFRILVMENLSFLRNYNIF